MFAFKIQINCLQNKQIWISLLFKFATNGKNNLKKLVERNGFIRCEL